MIYRAGFYLGNKSYFPSNTDNGSESEIMTSFLAQFYQAKIPPKTILTNIIIDDLDILIQALSDLHKVKLNIIYPKNNKLKELIDIAAITAQDELAKKIAKKLKYSNLLDGIKDLLGIANKPERIEIFDNSHISGSHAVCAMVVFSEEGFQKKEYRTYNIKLVQDGDDYGMLREIMNRRLKKIEILTSSIPDLMIIDGGKGHLNIVRELMAKYNLDIPFICISKGKDRDAGGETIHRDLKDSFQLNNDSDIAKQIQIMRDEAHNFAISTYRKKHQKSLKTSMLENIENIGAARRKKLMNYFGSYEAIKKATIVDLSRVEGISENLAKKIFNILQDE
jgi:excinuclease ABC subunit C